MPNSTNANSPPWLMAMARLSDERAGRRVRRPRPYSTAILSPTSPSTSPTTAPGRSSTTRKSADIPTAMKNRPSSRPLNGSMLASRSWRYSESASSTPARNAPSAIDSPATCMSSDVLMTTRSALAVESSWLRASAMKRKAGRTRKRPATTRPTMMAAAMAACTHPLRALSATPLPSSGTSASIGMAATSWNRRIPNAARPWPLVSSFFSPSTCMANAVDDSDRPRAATTATSGPAPSKSAAAPTSAAVATTCKAPTPNTAPRMRHTRAGCSSSPITNRSSTTPSSAMCRVASTSWTRSSPTGPITAPAAR